ncbi:hypothetical protein FSP39_016651 [Pinctada imbricata]|uniref:Uncharacterized protein n=1 Tax=Pinctada imbricata TaxID=66713 RepID=A0AA89C1L1_PINIB|nr:hypothetical protein FSP39_016651 [Pinctada imbricata]
MYTYDWTNDTVYDVVLSRHKRDTNGTSSSSSSEEDLFGESNKLAMYVVIPIMFLVYGGCACIYCCYKCRQYVKENSPKQIFRKFMGKDDNEEEEEDEEEDNNFGSGRFSSRREDALKSSHPSLSSSPGPDTDVSYVDYDDMAMSTPGLGYPSRHVDKKGSIRVLGTIENENTNVTKPSGSDSGIQGDSNLTDLSGTASSNKCIVESIPTAAPISTAPQVQTAAVASYTAAPVKRVMMSEMGTQTESVTIIDSEQYETTDSLGSSTHSTPCQEPGVLEGDYDTKDTDSVIVMTNVESSENLVPKTDEKQKGTTKQSNKGLPNVSRVRPRYMDVFSAKSRSNDTRSVQLSKSEANNSKSDTKEGNNNQNHRSKWSGIRNILPKYLDLFKASKSNSNNSVDNRDKAKDRENKNTKSGGHNSTKNSTRNSSQSKGNSAKNNVVLDDIENIDENINVSNSNSATFKGTETTPKTVGKPKPRYLDHFNQSNKSNDKNGKSGSNIAETSLSNVKAEAHATYIGSSRSGNTNTPDIAKKPSVIKVSTKNDENGQGRGSGNKGKRTGTGNSMNNSKKSVSVISLDDMDPRQYIVPTWK